ncbi:P-loop containing nucleoside triphosphate hydrolase protein [Delitschia confertaspora ATCC 74209]|uniref:P-loop containing nucleoside triphosphate hydrolase protein n=1 Tax=Delitschia confertaspora ATCC 74209 TaxID=1513339 RepID=A0A9P4JW66_9PLEO|nr:P-loop containing nucleoside triphosphate hydrolase protein [Delitschia confertaspora ATCC 74209]
MRVSISSQALLYRLSAGKPTFTGLKCFQYLTGPILCTNRHDVATLCASPLGQFNTAPRHLRRYERRQYHSNISHQEDTTIYALSTATGRAAIAVIRISGPACKQIYQSLCPSAPFPKPRHATLRKLYSPNVPPSPSTILDSGALILFFPAPHTVTGEDVLELHVHGGPAIVRAVLAAIPECASSTSSITSGQPNTLSAHTVRYAESGEFTRRAFLNNRMTLPQIESLGETLSATTEQQRKLSVRGTTSSLAARYEEWRNLLLQARGELEALIDFSEDQHFDESPTELCGNVAVQVRKLRRQIETHVSNAVRGELLRNGISVALLGAPNAGKSSLLNRIVGREAAIVSQEAGTTRDVVEVGVDLGGWLVKLGDMAGLRRAGVVGPDTIGTVEQEGIKRAKQRALGSDVLIVVQDAATDMDPEVTETAKRCVDLDINVVIAINKIDQIPNPPESVSHWKNKVQSVLNIPEDRIFFISCKAATKASSTVITTPNDPGNIQRFLQGLITTFESMTTALIPDFDASDSPPDPSIWQESLGATERQRALLSECLSHLEAFLTAVHGNHSSEDASQPAGTTATAPQDLFIQPLNDTEELGDDVDIVIAAECLRLAAETLARITGRGESGDVEEVLGVVFEK